MAQKHHKEEESLGEWVKENEPSVSTRTAFIVFFAICGVMPFAAGPAVDVAFPSLPFVVAIVGGAGTNYLHSLHSVENIKSVY